MQLRIWAPYPRVVELALRGDRHPMTRGDDGWWSAEQPAAAGDRYAFVLDGGPPRPDPRSVRQPDGIDAPSAVYDHDAHEWGDADWIGFHWPGAVLYELHIGTFSAAGTFDGAVEHLTDLVALGVDAVEVMPVAGSSGARGWGYDGVDLFAVQESLGGPDGFKRFVDACHAHGLGVLLDVVYNHLGPVGNHLAEMGPYFTDRHQTPWGAAVNFDGDDAHEVRRFVIDNALGWLRDFHVDGLRLDAVHAIVDDSTPHVLAELGAAAEALAAELGRDLVVIAESDLNDPVFVRPRPAGYGLRAAWADDWHHALHVALTGESDGYYCDYQGEDDLAKAIEQAWVLDGAWSSLRGRDHGSSPVGLPAEAFVVATQNHDQIGNRAAGERLGALTTEGRLHIAAALLLTSPFTPMLFQGEEWGASTPFLYFTDHADLGLARVVTDGRRSEFESFGWDADSVPDPQAQSTFQRSVLDWDERDQPPHARLLSWHHDLLALRRAEPDLHDPAVPARAKLATGVLRVERGGLLVVANLSGDDQPVDLADGEVLLTSDERVGQTGVLPADTVAIVRRSGRTAGG